jgi:molybdopterin biosynthesis enzyme
MEIVCGLPSSQLSSRVSVSAILRDLVASGTEMKGVCAGRLKVPLAGALLRRHYQRRIQLYRAKAQYGFD